VTDHIELLTSTVARHFPNARVEDDQVELGFGDVRIGCQIGKTAGGGELHSAALYFHLQSDKLSRSTVFASISGYGASAEAAIIEGACHWCCSFGPVLQASLGSDPPAVDHVDLDEVPD